MKLNKMLLGCILFACAANSTEFKLESTTGGDYFKVKSTGCVGAGIAMSFIEGEIQLFNCGFAITAKQEIEVLDVDFNENIPKKLNKCNRSIAFIDLNKSNNPMTDGIVDKGETIHYTVLDCISNKIQ